MVNAGDVQKLREITGAGIMECKKALEEAKGDFKKAQEVLQRRGFERAEKKMDRAANAGRIESYVHNERVGVMLELFCETDFVAKADVFKELAHSVAMQIAAMDPKDEKELYEQAYIKDPSFTIEALVRGVIAKVGENIKMGKFVRFEI